MIFHAQATSGVLYLALAHTLYTGFEKIKIYLEKKWKSRERPTTKNIKLAEQESWYEVKI